MTFYPDKGITSTEEFNNSDGSVFTNPSLQGVRGGHVVLLNSSTGYSTFVKGWKNITNWGFENNLTSIPIITGDFNRYTGNIDSLINTVSGFVGINTDTTALTIRTSYPALTTGGYSGAGAFGIMLSVTSPNSSFYSSFASGTESVTVQFDVAALDYYSGYSLAGFSVTGNNLTGLPALTGVVGHGVLISNGSVWDYIEVTPDGIRSLNHPEIALPLNLYSPKRIRIGIESSNIYLASEDGNSVIGYNKFDTELGNPVNEGLIFFGAPGKDLTAINQYDLLQNIDGMYGHTLWDNIKILYDEMSIYEEDEIKTPYSTGFVTMYSPVFNPGIAINKYLNAGISYVPYKGGVTVVTAQYSGLTGWINSSSTTLGTDGVDQLDLSTVPIYNYPRVDGTVDYLNNPIRFKIDQRSYSGVALPPAVSEITVNADKDRYEIDLLPDWKPSNTTVKVKFGLDTGSLFQEGPTPEIWSNVVINSPHTTGLITGNAFLDEAESLQVRVVGSGEVVLNGPYGSCISNYVITNLIAVTGTPAADVFGSTSVSNIYPNPLFADPFREIGTGEANYISGLTQGYLSEYVKILPTYTGTFKVEYTQDSIYRPEAQARVNKIKQYLGQSSVTHEEYSQGFYVYPSSDIHQGKVGLQTYVPSGIATGNLAVDLEVRIEKGEGLYLEVSGSSIKRTYLPGEFYREFSPVSIKTTTTNSNLSINLYVPSGFSGQEYKVNIDNLTVSPYRSSYLEVTGINLYTHTTGISTRLDPTSGSAYLSPAYSNLSLIGNFYLDSYPDTNASLMHLIDNSDRGLKIDIDNSGHIQTEYRVKSLAWEIDLGEFTDTLYVSSNKKVPLGRWFSLGFYHDNHTYSGFEMSSSFTDGDKFHYASTSKIWLAIDGCPVGNADASIGWTSFVNQYGAGAPFVGYIDSTSPNSLKIMSGVFGKTDGIHLSTPPTSEVEVELGIKSNKSLPYFVPDVLFKSGPALPSGAITNNTESDFYIGNLYNFSSPYYPGWDRGPIRNHLILSGNYYIEDNSPYGNLKSTRLTNGSSAIATYSSSYQSIVTSNSRLGLSVDYDSLTYSLTGVNRDNFGILGWIYPTTTGKFFSYYGSSDTASSRIDIGINTGYQLTCSKYATGNMLQYIHTGHVVPSNTWSYFYLNQIRTGNQSISATGVINSYIGSTSGLSTYIYTGTHSYLSYSDQSHMVFHGIDISLFNFMVPIIQNNTITSGSYYYSTGDKLGRYQAVLEDRSLFTGNQYYDTYNEGHIYLGPTTGSTDRYISVAYMNSYDSTPKLQGIIAYDDKPFREVPSYSLSYDTTEVRKVFGSTDSPIRLGTQVPRNAINLARYSSPSHTVPSSVATIDLSDSNVNNLISYRNGEYLVGKGSYFTTSLVSGYQNINSGIYSGMLDVTISGQVVSADINITNHIISDINFDQGYPAYYYYLVGRGNKAVQSLGTYAHYTGQLLDTSTGSTPENYIANLERIKNSISVKNRKGEIIDKQTYPYDVVISPYSVETLSQLLRSGQSVNLDNVGTSLTGNMLPTNIFSVILLTHYNRIEGESIFVHYDAYDLSTRTITPGHKEIINPLPIFRERHPSEEPKAGVFDLNLNVNGYYDLNLYAINSNYSGQL